MSRSAWLAFAVLAWHGTVVQAQTATAAVAAPAKAEVCTACHGPGDRSVQAQFPVLAGQTSRYMYLQLRDY